ncbi:hypothetical protein AGMMS49982_09110 [Bacteroidia bacterium]|nr:hypothetical protein AGMMS49982_09110 [Bacteroidia bacterium]
MQYASITAEATMDSITSKGTPTIDYGQRTSQIVSWSPALVAGIDYVVTPGMLIGLEITPVSYYHSKVSLYAAHGLAPAIGVAKEWLFLSQPKLKIGFRF